MSYPNDPNLGRQAASGFMSGFSGCLGVGLAILVVFGIIIAGCAAFGASQNSSQASGTSTAARTVPAAAPAAAIKSALGPGPSTPPESATAKKTCKTVHGSFARDESWSPQQTQAYKLYECDSVPYLANDGSIYVVNLRYNSQLQLVPQNVGADVSAHQCANAIYAQADSNPGPGIWNGQLGLCTPTTAQIRNWS